MKFVKNGSDSKETYELFHHVAGVTEKEYPAWLKAAVKSGDVYVDEIDGQRYIKGEENPKTGEHGRLTICDNECIVRDSKGGLVPYPIDYVLENFISADAETAE